MIYVDRATVSTPEVLHSSRAEAERKRIEALLSTASAEHLEQLRVTFVSSIWAPTRPALLDLFHGKCAYCESPIRSLYMADIEHFRPKQGATDGRDRRLQLYYAWLAYDWDNLLIACVNCNRQHGKAQNFPIVGPRAPMLASVEECRRVEKAILLDPCFDNPAEHLVFGFMGVCSGITDRGRLTIRLLDLNRPQLIEERKRRWGEVSLQFSASISEILSEPERGVAAARSLEDMLSGKQPFTAVARAAFKQNIDQLKINVDTGSDLSGTVQAAQIVEILARAATAGAARPLEMLSDLRQEDKYVVSEAPAVKAHAVLPLRRGRELLPEFARTHLINREH